MMQSESELQTHGTRSWAIDRILGSKIFITFKSVELGISNRYHIVIISELGVIDTI